MKKMNHLRLFESHKLFEAVKEIPKELLEKIIADLKDNPKTVYWDRNDNLSDEHIDSIIGGNLDKFYEDMVDVTVDITVDLEIEAIEEALEEHKDEVDAWIGEDINMKDLAMELRDEYSLYDYIMIDEDWDQLFRNTGDVNCRVSMWSNYEGLQSDYMETQGKGYDYANDDYFMHMVNILNLNPAKVEAELNRRNINNADDFPNIPERDGKEFVKYDEFATELENNTTLSQLTFVGKVDLNDVFKKAKTEENPLARFTIPKGNYCGLFGSGQGGGSIMEMELLKDFPIDTTKPYFEGGTKYDEFSIMYDKTNSYSIQSVYGVTRTFWGGDIEF